MDDKQKLWIKLFKSEGRYYCYDVNTNNIMEIDEVLYLVLQEYDYLNEKEVIDKLTPFKKRKKILNAVNTIKENNKKGFFISKRDKKVNLSFSFNKSEYKKLLKNLLNHLILNITDNCNFRCQYCKFANNYYSNKNYKRKSMELSTIKKSIDFFISNAKYIIEKTKRDLVLGFYGGEPLLEFNKIMKSIDYLETKFNYIFDRFRFSMTINGSLFNKTIIKKLIKYNFQLLVSLDGSKNIHDRYRVYKNGKGTFNDILNNLNLIKEIDEDYFNKKVGFSIVLAPEYDMASIINFFRNKLYNYNRVYIMSDVEDDGTKFLDKFNMKLENEKIRNQQIPYKKEYIQNKISGKNDVLLTNLFENSISDVHYRMPGEMPLISHPNGICLPGLQKLFIDTNGNFHVCEKIDWAFSIGNIKNGFNLKKIFYLINTYIEKTNDKCENCWAVRLCRDCYLSAIRNDGFSDEEKEKSCKIRKTNLLKGLKDYVHIIEKNQNAFGKEERSEPIAIEAYRFLGRI